MEGLEGNASSVTLDAMWAGSGGAGCSEEWMVFLASVCLVGLRNRIARFLRLLEGFVRSDIGCFGLCRDLVRSVIPCTELFGSMWVRMRNGF